MSNVITLEEMQQSILTTRIQGVSPLIQHKWSEKALNMLRDKHAGVKVKKMLLTFAMTDASVSQLAVSKSV